MQNFHYVLAIALPATIAATSVAAIALVVVSVWKHKPTQAFLYTGFAMLGLSAGLGIVAPRFIAQASVVDWMVAAFLLLSLVSWLAAVASAVNPFKGKHSQS